MIENVDLEQWLTQKSVRVERRGVEIVFTHDTGAKSVLVFRTPAQLGLLEVQNVALSPFYDKFVCGSIGDSMLMLASTVAGGSQLSLGYRVRDFAETDRLARELGVTPLVEEDLFMIGSLGSFFYAYNRKAPQLLRCYDRDFGGVHENQSFLQVIEEWYQVSVQNPKIK